LLNLDLHTLWSASKITSVERPTFSYQLTPTTQLLAHTVHTRTMQQ